MSAAHAVQSVEVEAALQRIARGEGDFNDANLLRAIYQQMQNEINQLREQLAAVNPA